MSLSEAINHPLSDHEVLNLVRGKARVILYPKLKNVKNIDEILKPYNSVYLLYIADSGEPNIADSGEPNTNNNGKIYGHWTCLNLYKGGLEYFDPYGRMIDYYQKIRKQPCYLTNLLLKCSYKLYYNEYQFQKISPKVKDCGRWSALRILLRDMPLNEFAKVFQGPNSDEIVTTLTM